MALVCLAQAASGRRPWLHRRAPPARRWAARRSRTPSGPTTLRGCRCAGGVAAGPCVTGSRLAGARALPVPLPWRLPLAAAVKRCGPSDAFHASGSEPSPPHPSHPPTLAPNRRLEQPYQRQASHPLALERQPYALRPWEAIKLACRRQLALMSGDKTMIRGRIGQVGDSTAEPGTEGRAPAACVRAAAWAPPTPKQGGFIRCLLPSVADGHHRPAAGLGVLRADAQPQRRALLLRRGLPAGGRCSAPVPCLLLAAACMLLPARSAKLVHGSHEQARSDRQPAWLCCCRSCSWPSAPSPRWRWSWARRRCG